MLIYAIAGYPSFIFYYLVAFNSKTRHVRHQFGNTKMRLGGVTLFWYSAVFLNQKQS